jgi:cap1 methyltransferase
MAAVRGCTCEIVADGDGGGDADPEAVKASLALAKDSISHALAGWDACKRDANPYELVSGTAVQTPSRPVSRSFFKLWEMLHVFPELASAMRGAKVAMVAEGPGGFAQAALHHGAETIDVVTLVSRTAPRMRVVDARVRVHTIDGSGDICRNRVQRGFVAACTGASVFTADGGFDMHGVFEHQESQSAPLIEAEVMMGIALLRPGGACIVKFFDMFLPRTQGALSWIADSFDAVHVYKPCTSRPANSERYVVGLGFRPSATACAIARRVVGTGPQPAPASGFQSSIDRSIVRLAVRQICSIKVALSQGLVSADQAHSQLLHALQWCHAFGLKVHPKAFANYRQAWRLRYAT